MRSAEHIQVRVPGKIMLSGEYAVLQGGRSVAMSLARYMTLDIRRSQEQSTIQSDLWDSKTFDIKKLPEETRNSPLARSLNWAVETYEPPAFHLQINSEIKPNDGFGSSSAVRLGSLVAIELLSKPFLCAAINETQDISLNAFLWRNARQSFKDQRDQQSQASGYDILSQCLGSITCMSTAEKSWPGVYERFIPMMARLPILIFKGGSGADTGPVMRETLAWIEENKLMPKILEASENFSQSIVKCLHENSQPEDLQHLFESCGQFRGLFEKSPHYPKKLLEPLEMIDGCDKTWSFKTTGAGGEDALLLFGDPSELKEAISYLESNSWKNEPCKLDTRGIRIKIEQGLS